MIKQRPSAQYLADLRLIIDHFPIDALDECIERVYAAYVENRTIFVAGNGGSAATASHFAADFNKNIAATGRRPKVIALCDNAASMTAWANDANFTDVFTEQLKNFYSPGDIFIAISGSGRSANILSAAAWVLQNGGTVIGLTGAAGESLKAIADVTVMVPSQRMEQIEDFHVVCMHAMVIELRHRCLSPN